MFQFMRRKEAPEVKASATGRVVAYASGGRVAWSPRDVVSLTKQGFAGNPVGYRCVKLVSEAASALPLVLDGVGGDFAAHPAMDLLARPNLAQGGRAA